ncbi:MAG: hypothetical protein WD049_03285 [Candidatus Paceibacterota bacterium]
MPDRLDGCQALTFVARVRGDELSIRDWDWHDASFIDEAIELLGETEVRYRLDNKVVLTKLWESMEPTEMVCLLRVFSNRALPSDQFEVHSILFDVIKMLENNDDADASQLGVVAYAMTPCETCRLYAARHLHRHHAAPDWLVAECRFDSVKDCRRLGEDGNATSERKTT